MSYTEYNYTPAEHDAYGSNDITVLEYLETLSGGTAEHVMDYSSQLAVIESGQKYSNGTPIVFCVLVKTQKDITKPLSCRIYIPFFFELLFDKHKMSPGFREHAKKGDITEAISSLISNESANIEEVKTIDEWHTNISIVSEFSFSESEKENISQMCSFFSSVKMIETFLSMLERKLTLQHLRPPPNQRMKMK